MTFARFTLAYWCVLIAALLPVICAGIAKAGMYKISRREGGYDNDNPRAWLARQTDWRARADAAQQNSFEALPFFIGAVIIAHQLGAHQARLDVLAFLFIFLACFTSWLMSQAWARCAPWSGRRAWRSTSPYFFSAIAEMPVGGALPGHTF